MAFSGFLQIWMYFLENVKTFILTIACDEYGSLHAQR